MHYLKTLLKRFHRDESGAFLVLFGVLAIVLVATSGAVVDFSAIEQARTRAQVALDAAALGLQPHVFDEPTPADSYFIGKAQLLLEERLGLDGANDRISVEVTDATVDDDDGQLLLEATVEVPTYFVALVGIESVRAHIESEATRKRLNLEVAMVLDNSGSMKGDRMTKLKEAANNAADILFDEEDSQPNVFVSVIPFTQYVNVGTANRTAVWMSQTGASSISHLHFDDDDNDATAFTSTVSRWDLYDNFDDEAWAGCVEARIGPYDADDTTPNSSVPDTMFQPVFAPDSPVDNYLDDEPSWCEYTRQCKRVRTDVGCNSSGGSCDSNSTVYTGTYPDGTTDTGVCSCSGETYTSDNTVITHTGGSNYKKVRTRICTDHYEPSLSAREKQERLCKYDGASFSGDGPNSDCGSTAILPLTNIRATVKGRITDMEADGSTNIEQGAIWGFHSLSSTEPLTEGRAYTEATSKVMIVMTDGENNINYDEYSDTQYGVSSWMAWGFRSDKRLLTESTTPKDSVATSAQVIAEVNRRTELACTNAKAKGIIVYTIGLSVPNATTKTMLQNCATPSTTVGGVTTVYSFFPTTTAALVTVFEDIASQLSELRLAK